MELMRTNAGTNAGGLGLKLQWTSYGATKRYGDRVKPHWRVKDNAPKFFGGRGEVVRVRGMWGAGLIWGGVRVGGMCLAKLIRNPKLCGHADQPLAIEFPES